MVTRSGSGVPGATHVGKGLSGSDSCFGVALKENKVARTARSVMGPSKRTFFHSSRGFTGSARALQGLELILVANSESF
jgi:hypothetical protein